MTRLYETGGAQPVKVSKTCVWRDRSRAALLMGTRASQLLPLLFLFLFSFIQTVCSSRDVGASMVSIGSTPPSRRCIATHVCKHGPTHEVTS